MNNKQLVLTKDLVTLLEQVKEVNEYYMVNIEYLDNPDLVQQTIKHNQFLINKYEQQIKNSK